MASIIYLLCAATALACAWLLLWSGLCFSCLVINNILLILDRIVFPEPDVDLTTWRLASALVALLPLLYGLIWEDD